MGILVTRSSASVGAGGNDGLVVSDYANYDPDAAQIISLDVNNTIPNWGTAGGASITFANESWWNGTEPVATMFPPTTGDQASGFGSIPFWKSATKAVRQLNFRIEFRASDAFCADTTEMPKFFIFRSARTLNISAPVDDRPMSFWIHGNYDASLAANTICLCPAIGTLRMHSSTNIVPAANYQDRIDSGNTDPGTSQTMAQPFYIRATSGTDGSGNPILAASEIICIEYRINVMATADEPDGVVGYRVYRRNGAVYERCCAWNWDQNYLVDTNYIYDIDTMGGGYFNLANSGAADIWTKIGRRMTMAFNLQPTVGRSWIGPPTGFVT